MSENFKGYGEVKVKEYIEYLGSEKLQISENEMSECKFYLLKKSNKHIKIFCDDYFILDEGKRYCSENTINTIKEYIIVTLQGNLTVNDEIIKFRNEKVSREVLEQFLYTLALYYIENSQYNNAKLIIANTEDINAYIDLINGEDVLDKELVMKNLRNLVENKNNRFKSGKAKIRIQKKEVKQRCIIEILKEILEDSKSKLLWDFTNDYERVSSKRNMIDNKLKFNRFNYGYGEVTDLNIGSKKANIGVKVKVKGQVENLENNLKLDACIYREYNIISNGKVNNNLIYCILSKNMKSRFLKEKIIKIVSNSKYNKEQVYALDISKIPITNSNMLKLLNREEIAQYLYDIEVLKCKNTIINNRLKVILEENKLGKIQENRSLSKEQIDVRKDFRVNSYGVYIPEYIEEEEEFEIYVADIIQWGVINFSKKEKEFIVNKQLKKVLNEDINITYRNLMEELDKAKKERKIKEDLVNIIKISAFILNVNIFNWEKEEYKKKLNFDKKINNNVVIGGRSKINTIKINDINVKQEYFRIIVKSAYNKK